MAKNRQHQWEPVPDSEDLVKCAKCGTEVKSAQARKGIGPCTWGEKADPPKPTPDQKSEMKRVVIVGEQPPNIAKLIEAAAEATEHFTQDELEENARIMRETNLCDTCMKQPAECESNPKFGTGIGNDNVYECDGYTEGEKLPGRPIGVTYTPPKRSGPRLTDPPEICNACGDQLAILPLNSRLDMVACNNSRCALYRERIRMVTKPSERGKHNRAKG